MELDDGCEYVGCPRPTVTTRNYGAPMCRGHARQWDMDGFMFPTLLEIRARFAYASVLESLGRTA